ncbi:MAG: 1-deoxy-D-xylulose-5-phosphate reductoisomerase [Acidimicrobiia bacterium]|nr:1-deoxy-D-xylulose-5-phosphate reductoisomerase [Acidimicrobiia bacterium]
MTTTVGVIGSTGSIGTQTLDLVAADPDRYDVVALAAGSNLDLLVEQVRAFRPRYAAIGDETKSADLAAMFRGSTEVLAGPSALADLAEVADVTVNGVVGFAGLPVTLGCLQAGKRLALANKESLIAAGPVVQVARRTPGAELLPVDSEHAAIHMCLRANDVKDRVERLQLTASGGPFRGRARADLATVSIDDALAHPTWSMGPKITIDSSTLMNKGLEVIEANELFGTPAGPAGYGITFDEIEVVVHPQSIVHSMVTFSDGSTIAQLSHPDMRLPIGYALAYPDRFPVPYGRIDWSALGRLDFELPDTEAFPCLELAFTAGRVGGTAPAWLSAANEVAVEAFLAGRIAWIDIPDVIESVLAVHDGSTADTLEGVLDADAEARRRATEILGRTSLMARP